MYRHTPGTNTVLLIIKMIGFAADENSLSSIVENLSLRCSSLHKDYPNFPHEAKGSSIDRVYCRKINEGAGPITITYIYIYYMCSYI